MEGGAIVESEVRRNEYEVEEKCARFLLGVRPLLLTFSYDNRSLRRSEEGWIEKLEKLLMSIWYWLRIEWWNMMKEIL